MQRILSAVCCLALCTAFAACNGDGDTTPNGDLTTFELQQDASGDLEFCARNTSSGISPDSPTSSSEDGASPTCESLPNPRGCTKLIITVDPTGKTCETCAGPNGEAIAENCGDGASVACQVVTIPDPDCVVCAYVNGTVIYSTCQPKDRCDNVACPAIARICPDGQVAEPDPNSCCGQICKPRPCDIQTVCPAIDCAPGYRLGPPTEGNCCGSCVPERCVTDDDCPDYSHCSTRDGDCLGCGEKPNDDMACPAVCFGVCVPKYLCPQVMALPPGACPGGTVRSAGVDQYGCPRGDVCFCPDGTIAPDGVCKK